MYLKGLTLMQPDNDAAIKQLYNEDIKLVAFEPFPRQGFANDCGCSSQEFDWF